MRDRAPRHRDQPERDSLEQPAPTRPHERPYLSKERFALVHQVHNLDPSDRHMVVAVVGELRRTIEPSFDAVLRTWQQMERKNDTRGQYACAFLWSALEQEQRKRPAVKPPAPAPPPARLPAAQASPTSPDGARQRPPRDVPQAPRETGLKEHQQRSPDRKRSAAAPREVTLHHLSPELQHTLPPIQARHVDRLLDPTELPLKKAAFERSLDVAKAHLGRSHERATPADVLAAWQKETARELAAKKAGQPIPIERVVDHPAFASLYLAAHQRAALVPPGATPQPQAAPLRGFSEREGKLALERLQGLPEARRDQIVAAAHGLMLDGKTTREEARASLPAALDALKRDASKENAIHALTLTAIAHVHTVDEYVAALERTHPRADLEEKRRRATEDEVRHADSTAMSLRESVQSRFTDAALRAAVLGDRSQDAPDLALVLFDLRQHDPADPTWEDVGRHLVAALKEPHQQDDISITDVD